PDSDRVVLAAGKANGVFYCEIVGTVLAPKNRADSRSGVGDRVEEVAEIVLGVSRSNRADASEEWHTFVRLKKKHERLDPMFQFGGPERSCRAERGFPDDV